MSSEVKVPTLGESVSEATIGQWLKQPGDSVKADEPIASLETDKVAIEVMAPVSGVLAQHMAKEGDTVSVGALIATIGEAGSAAAAVWRRPRKPLRRPRPPPAALGPTSRSPQLPATARTDPARRRSDTPGSIAESSDAAVLSPSARRAVLEYGIDPASVRGTGKDGRLTKEDVVAAAQAKTAPSTPAPPPAATPVATTMPAPAASGDRREERVKMTRLRQTIARRLKSAQETAALLTTFNDVDMSAVIAARDKYRDLFEKKHGSRLGFMGFFAKAACLALKDVPAANAYIEGDEIIYHDYVDLSVAVSAPNGLVVPVVRDAHTLSFAGIERAIADYGRKAKDGALTIDDMRGGTFTISNGGVFGSLMSTPIINPPQSAVLGLHRIEDRPVVRGGQIVIRPMMYLALSYDHRLIDGREAVTALKIIKDAIEDPTRLLIDL